MCAIGVLIRIIVVCLYTDFLCWLFSLFLVMWTGASQTNSGVQSLGKASRIYLASYVNASIYGLILCTRDWTSKHTLTPCRSSREDDYANIQTALQNVQKQYFIWMFCAYSILSTSRKTKQKSRMIIKETFEFSYWCRQEPRSLISW